MGYVLGNEKEYIRYTREGAAPESRGRVKKTEDESEAFVFPTREDAEAERTRLSKAAGNMTVREVKRAALSVVGSAKGQPQAARRKRFTPEERIAVYLKDNGRCYLCGDFVEFSDFEIEHMIPLSCGGTNGISNLRCSCHTCNSMKGTFPARDVIAQAEKIARYHARTAREGA